MPTIELEEHADFQDWQPLARHLLSKQIPPDDIRWNGAATGNLFGDDDALCPDDITDASHRPSSIRISRQFIGLARFAAAHRDPQRFDVLYRLLWRLFTGERKLLQDAADPLVITANRLAKEVGRDRHKMQAFVRFRALDLKDINSDRAPTIYTAWFEPDHYILRLNADFFCRRFHNMDWTIASPYQSLHWIERKLFVGAGTDRSQLPDHDDYENYWRCYFANIFNPARLKIQAMQNEMPKKYWHNLPEAPLIQHLVKGAGQREQAMLLAPPKAAPKLPSKTRFDRERWLKKKRLNPEC
ncbi:putative DNA metabolism protein [Litorivivens lipolytica]|uniref:Putative DNA metabolism protein n=1 Tax=Litorivivens lipolytica TaxID=1524264 RepID=A0A7W4Z6F0_9GAMM|nr:TIGR03915 family putative DNA repair protein [Litorivivens lipolytica]MBB3048198.1 putative DNA metabolism protein [Litorivivens lipolytica]